MVSLGFGSVERGETAVGAYRHLTSRRTSQLHLSIHPHDTLTIIQPHRRYTAVVSRQ